MDGADLCERRDVAERLELKLPGSLRNQRPARLVSIYVSIAAQERGNIMERGRLTTIASAFAIAALGLGLGLAGPAPASGAVSRTGSAAPQHVVLNCLGKAQVRPGTIALACADDNDGLTHLHWTSWTPQLASAYGTEWANDCQPDCAMGHVHYYPVLAMLWGSAAVTGHPGERRYTTATLSYPKGRPAVYVTGRNGRVVATYPVIQKRTLGA